MNKFFRSASMAVAALVMVATLALQSCGSKSDNLVPADATVVATLNFSKVIKSAGGDINSKGEITLPAQLAQSAQVQAMASMASSMIEPFDLDDVIIYTRDDNFDSDFVIIVGLRDAEKANSTLKQFFSEPKSQSGYNVYSVEDKCIAAVKDNHLFIAEELDDVTDGLKAASKKAFSANGAVNDYLNSGAALSVVVNPGKYLPTNYAGNWICGNLDFKDQSMFGELVMMNVDGKRVEFGNAIDVMSTDFLRYIPSDAQSVFAIGAIADATLKNNLNSVAPLAGEFADAITGLNGTIAIAGGASESFNQQEFLNNLRQGNIELKDINLLAMAHYSETALPKVMSLLNQLFAQEGTVTEKDGQSVVTIQDQPVYFGSADSYAIISTDPINANSENPYNTLCEGKRAVIASIQQPGQNPYGFTFGQTASLWLESDAVKLNATFTSTDKPFIAVLIEVFSNPKIQQQIFEAIQQAQQMDESFGGFAGDDDFLI